MDDERNTTGSSTYHIDKLTETNYRSWAQQLRWILDERDLWELVEGKEVKPVPPQATTSTGESTSAVTTEMQRHQDELSAWLKKAKKARSIIGSSISASTMVYVEGIDNPAEMWRVLSERFNPITKTTLLQVIKQFMTIKMDEAVDTMEAHLQKVQRLKRRVEEQGEAISENIYNAILLSSVPETYHVAVSILESQEQLTPTIIINRLLEESRKLDDGMENSGGKSKTALFSNTKPRKSGKSVGNKSGIKGSKKGLHCEACNKDGHSEDSCWTLHPELKPKKGRKDGNKDAKIAMRAVTKSASTTTDDQQWYVDSGASDHFSPYKHLFETYETLAKPVEIETSKEGINGQGIGKGLITVEVIAGSKINVLSIEAVYAPDLDSNLLSTTTLLDKGFEVSMKPRIGAKILKNGVLIADTIREGKLFRLKTVQHSAAKAVTKCETPIEDINVWHGRLGHLGEQNIRKLQSMADGIRVNPKTTIGICEDCQSGRQCRHPNHEPSKHPANEILGRVFSDLCGPITPASIGGNNYALLFIDEKTGMAWIYGLKTKKSMEVLSKFKEFKENVELESGKKIKILRTDGGGEYEKHMENYL